jgi:hypothetical protein
MARGYTGHAYVTLFPMLLAALFMAQLVNITHIDGMNDDFSNLVLEAQSENGSALVAYEIASKEDGAWALVNASVPEGAASFVVLVSGAEGSISRSQEPRIFDIAHFPGVADDFSNLRIQLSSPGSAPQDVAYSVVAKEDGKWAVISLARAPEGSEAVSIMAAVTFPATQPGEAASGGEGLPAEENSGSAELPAAAPLNITWSDGLAPDFSNLTLRYVDAAGRSEDVQYSIITMELGGWASIMPSRAPGEGEIVSTFAGKPSEITQPGIASQKQYGCGGWIACGQPADGFGNLSISWKHGESMASLRLGNASSRVRISRGAFYSIRDLKNGSTARVLVSGDFRSANAIRSMAMRNLTVMEMDQSLLMAMAGADAGVEIYEDVPVSASLADSIRIIRAAAEDFGDAGVVFSAGNGTAVCLLDTGVDYADPQFGGRVISGYDLINDDADAADDNGHGTAMASVIHAIAPDATIIAVKVLDSSGSGYSSDIIQGVDYCRQAAASGSVTNDSVRVLSMSFGGGSFDSYCDADPLSAAVQDAYGDGILPVASSGNCDPADASSCASITLPACAMNAAAVASTSKSDEISGFSRISGLVDLLAPGEDITVGGTGAAGGGAQAMSGTSLSAAHVSGAAAVLSAGMPGIGPGELTEILRATGILIERNGTIYPRIDVLNAALGNSTWSPPGQAGGEGNGTLGSPLGAAGWANATFGKCMNLTIINASTSAHTDFPAYVRIAYDSDMLPDYSDLRFYNASCGSNLTTVLLAHEIENYTASGADVWVRIPRLSGANTTISVYYGNSSPVASAENASGVWASSYGAVWHMKENPAGTAPQVRDSTANNNDGTTYGSMPASAQVAGQVDGALSFDGSNDYVNISRASSIEPSTAITASAWFYWRANSSSNAKVLHKGRTSDTGPYYSYTLEQYSNTRNLSLGINVGGTRRYVNTPAVSLNAWHQVVLTWSTGDYVRAYIDGAQAAVTSTTYSGSITYYSVPARIGYSSYNQTNTFFNGTIDEVEVSSTARSAQWINQSYQMQKNNSRWVVFGTEQSAGVPRPVNVTLLSPATNSTDMNGFAMLRFNASSAGNITNCTLILNGAANQTNSSIVNGTPASFALSDLPAGNYTWNVNCTGPFGGNGSGGARSFSVVRPFGNGNVQFNASVALPSGQAVNATIELVDAGTNSTDFGASGGPAMLNVSRGVYDVRVVPPGQTIAEILFHEVNISAPVSRIADMDENVSGPANTSGTFAINAAYFNFTYADITINAIGHTLLKCADWNLTNRSCAGNWSVFRDDLVAGQNYTFNLTMGDPGFAQYTYTEAGNVHKAYKSWNATALPPASGPNMPNEAEFNSTEYGQLNLSDNSYVQTNASGTYRAHRFLFNITQPASSIAQMNFTWEGYSSGNPSQRHVLLYAWNFTSGSWGSALLDVNPSSDTQYNVTLSSGFSDYVNSSGAFTFLAEGGTANNLILYTDYAEISVYYDNESPVSIPASPADGNVSATDDIDFTCNATDDMGLRNITLYWNYTGAWGANGTANRSGLSNQSTFRKENLANGDILWNCLACDAAGKCAFAASNRTLTVNSSATTIFFDGFETGNLSGWNLTTNNSGAKNWTVLNVSAYLGIYHAQSNPESANTPASTMEHAINASDYKNLTFSYRRWLVLPTSLKNFTVSWYNGTAWVVAESVVNVNDANYSLSSFSLPAAASNNPNFRIRFDCTSGAVGDFCRVDNVKVRGIYSPPVPAITSVSISPDPVIAEGTVKVNAEITDNINVSQALFEYDGANYSMVRASSLVGNTSALFHDSFESGSLSSSGWVLNGSRYWAGGSLDAADGGYAAEMHESGAVDPATMEVAVSTQNYQNVTIIYNRKLTGLDASDVYRVEWFNGTAWASAEDKGPGSADDPAYVFQTLALPSGASNKSGFKVRFVCECGAVTEYCRVDNVTVSASPLFGSDTSWLHSFTAGAAGTAAYTVYANDSDGNWATPWHGNITIVEPNITISEGLLNSTGGLINTTFEILDESNASVYNDTALSHHAELPKGKYKVKIKPKNGAITSVEFEAVEIVTDRSGFIKTDEPPASAGFGRKYAIGVDFPAAGTMTVNSSKGKAAFVCPDWDFEAQNCTGGKWKKVADIYGAQEYNVTLPGGGTFGFGEDNETFIMTDSGDYHLDSAQQILANNSGILDVRVTPSGPAGAIFGNVTVSGHNETSGLYDLRMERPTEAQRLATGFHGSSEMYSIDASALDFSNATVWVSNSTGNTVYKCANWDFGTQSCIDGNWTLFSSGFPAGQPYPFIITPGDPGFAEIGIWKAEHLDSNRSLPANIYPQVSVRDGTFAAIPAGDFVRVTFVTNLTSANDIRIFAKSNSSNASVKIYPKDSDWLVAESGQITSDQMYQMLLSGLIGEEDTFDIQVLGGPVEFDYIVDPPWSNTSFDRCKNITVKNASTSTLSNFTVYVNVSYDSDMLADYADLRFYSAACANGGSMLSYEVENYTNTTAHVWVLIPTLGPGNTTISMYYKNNTAVSSLSSPETTWDPGYVAVLHLAELGTGTRYDSTSRNSDGTPTNYDGDEKNGGAVDGADDLDGTNDYIQTTSNHSATANNLTWEVWFNSDNTSARHLLWTGNSGGNGWGAQGEMHISMGIFNGSVALNNYISYYFGTDNPPAVNGLTYNTTFTDITNFHYAVFEANALASSPAGNMYLDGALIGTDTGTTGGIDRSDWNTALRIGRPGANERYFDGIVDEIRVSNVSRSAQWINQTYLTMTNNSGWVIFGTEQNRPLVNVTLNSPADGNTTTVGTVNFNWTCVGSAATYTANLTIDGVVNVSGISCTNNTAKNQTVSGLSNDLHTWSVTCIDPDNNTAASATWSFTVDTSATGGAAPGAVAAYRSNTGSGLNYPRVRFWNSTGTGTWSSEVVLATAGSPVRWAEVKYSTGSDKLVLITQSDDNQIDMYVCTSNCTSNASWVLSGNLATVTSSVQARSFDFDFETQSGDAVVVYATTSTSASQDLAYFILPNASNNLSSPTVTYIDDTTAAGDVTFIWPELSRNPSSSSQAMVLAGYDDTGKDASAWIWNGSAFGSQQEIAVDAASTNSREALAVRWAADGSKAMAVSANGSVTGSFNSAFWNGSAWSAVSNNSLGTGAFVQWLNLKEDPATDDMQLVILDGSYNLQTAYWSGSAWTLSGVIDAGVDSTDQTREADFAWLQTGSTGYLVWDTDGAGTTISTRLCSPQCTGSTVTNSTYANTGRWITMHTNPVASETVDLLGVRMDSLYQLGSFAYNGTAFSNYGDTTFTTSVNFEQYECYSIAFKNTAGNASVTPVLTSLLLNATSVNNLTTDNLTCNYALNSTTASTAAVAWYVNSTPMMLLYLPMEGGSTNALLDYSGMGNNATNAGAAVWNATGGFDGNGSFRFDGTSTSYLNIGSPASLNFTGFANFSIAAWVRVDGGAGTHRPIVVKGDTQYTLKTYTNDTFEFCAYDGGWQCAYSDTTFTQGQWYYLVGRTNGSQVTLWVNGVQQAQTATHAGITANAYDVNIGRDAQNPTRLFNGSIDSVRVYNRSLSGAEILALYQNKTNLIVADETVVNETWQCRVTPFSNSSAGSTNASNNLTILAPSSGPSLTSLLLNATSSANLTTDNLTCNYALSNASTAAVSWYLNGTPLMLYYLPMEGNSSNALIDYSGNGYSATNNGATWNATGGYDGNGSLAFSGSAQYLNTTLFDALTTSNNFTISVWFKTRTTADLQHMLWMGNSAGNGWGASGTPTPEMHLSVGQSNGGATSGGALSFFFGGLQPNDTANVLYTNYTFTDTANWHLMTVVVSNLSTSPAASMYVDCNLIMSDTGDTGNTSRATWNRNLTVSNSGANTRQFNGSLDDIRIYNRSLSAAEISTLCQNKTNLIVAEETEVGDVWQCRVTPFSNSSAGSTNASNNLTVLVATPLNVTLNSPPNGSTTNNTLVTFNCSASATGNLSNITLYFSGNTTVLTRAWQAFNDVDGSGPYAGFPNITYYESGSAGNLTAYANNQTLPAVLNFTGGVNGGTTQGVLYPGTDAYAIFNGKVNITDNIVYYNTAQYYNFTGLNSSRRYRFVHFADRGNSSPTYITRNVSVIISDVAGFTVNSSAGVQILTTSVTNDTANYSSGYNTGGLVAAWINIDPGPDGDLVITVTNGTASGGYTSAILLEEYAVSGGVWAANETKSATGTTNTTTFTKNLTDNTTYTWNCYACDNASQCAFAPANYTVSVNSSYVLPSLTWCAFHYAHTPFSDGTSTAADVLAHMKQRYDCGGTNDHDTSLNQTEWDNYLAWSAGNNSDNNFTYFFGVEWTGSQHIYYVSLNPSATQRDAADANFDTVAELAAWMAQNSSVGHYDHPARTSGGTDFSNAANYNETWITAAEMINSNSGTYAWHWNYYFNCSAGSGCTTYTNPKMTGLQAASGTGWIKYALDQGIHLGFTCGNDWHSTVTGWEPECYTGVASPANWTRQGVYDAWKARHLWAAENKTKLSVTANNGSSEYIMGDIFTLKAATPNITINYNATASTGLNISNVSVFQNGVIINVTQFGTQNSVSGSYTLNLTNAHEDYVFIEAIQSNGQRAWSSPMWINYTSTGCPVITSPGTTTMTANYVGAPNNASPLSNFTCVKIASSNVTFDCAGYNITNNGTAGTTYGILVNSSFSNVTIRNCPGVSAYTYGIHLYTSNTSISNSSVFNDSAAGFAVNNSLATATTINLTGAIFRNATGGAASNFTNLSINDSVAAASAYQINWSAVPAGSLPWGIESFMGKCVNISTTNGTAAIDVINWFWADSELTGFNESKLEIWKSNSSGWTLLNLSADTAGNTLGLSALDPGASGVFCVLSDQLGPQVIWYNQTPADVDSLNVVGKPLNITYNLTDPSGINASTPVLYYKVNTTASDCWTYVNGSLGACGYQNRSPSSNASDLWLWRLWDNQVYPATYNLNESLMETTAHSSTGLTSASTLLKIQLLNVSNTTQYGFFEVMANQSGGTADLRVYYCNSSYSTGSPAASTSCTLFYTFLDNSPYNHTHTNYSSHLVAPFAINTTNGTINGVKVTSTSYFVLRPTTGTGTWNVYYISNVSRTNAIQSSANTGSSWSNFSGTVDSHLHQYEGNYTLWYYACANDSVWNSNCSSVSQDLLGLAGLPPTPPYVYSPENATYGASIPINYTAAVSPNGYPISYYNISLLNADGSFNRTIISNNSVNLNYAWDASGVLSGTYIVRVQACDNLSQCSYGYSELFTIGCPIINASGTYVQPFNLSGAPNPIEDVSFYPYDGYACVKIAASNVTYDCNGYSITHNATADAYVGFMVNASHTNVTLKNCPNVTGYGYGAYVHSSSNVSISNGTFANNTEGITLNNATGVNISYVNSTNNSGSGLTIESTSSLANVSSSWFCNNTIDLANFGANGTGRLDRCDSFINWSENGHYGCEYSCSSLWHRFFGNASGQIVLGNNTNYVHRWNATGFNMYFADSDSAISWLSLQAIGRNTTNGTATNDFTELDAAFGTSAFADNITATFSSDGSAPLATRNYTVYGRNISDVPIANSTRFNTTFRTGILWDTSDGGTQYGNAINQTTVWVVKVNASTSDTYGTYDFLGQIPYTLATREGGSSYISVYLELT